MDRLKTQWPNAYEPERQKIFFNAFKDVSNFDFRDAVTHCLANSRSAPLLPELTESIAKARATYFNQKRIDEADQKNAFLNIPDDGQSCDKEFKNKCMELYNNYMDGKINREQFYQGCDFLDQAAKLFRKNPVPKMPPPTTKLPYKNDDEDKPF
jgi:hypothetical protein